MNNSPSGGGQQSQQPAPHPPPQQQSGGIQIPGLLSPATALDHYRLSQLYQYAMAAERLRCPPGSGGAPGFLPPLPPGLRPDLAPFLYSPYCRIDPRLAMCRPPDEPKPQHSYIGLIAMAILSSPDKKLVLSDIYQYILDNYPYFRTRGPGWRNSIRHNLSLNDCFIKSGRSANGKGHYWAIHPANVDDFTKGDFRRRKAQRKVRRHMGLAVDDEDSPSPPPSSPPPVNWPDHPHHPLIHHLHQVGHLHPHHPHHFGLNTPHPVSLTPPTGLDFTNSIFGRKNPDVHAPLSLTSLGMNLNLNHHRKRQFDVASLLAPEKGSMMGPRVSPASTIKSAKSGDEAGETEQCVSSPSPPMCKVYKKSSPVESEDERSDETEEEQITVDEEKGPPRTGTRNRDSSSDNDNDKNDGDSEERRRRAGAVRRRRHHHRCDNSTSISPPSRDREERESHSTPTPNGSRSVNNSSPIMSTSLLECQQHQQQGMNLGPAHQPPQPGFHFNPTHSHHHLLQHNPSLASLMILSSRYRELTSGMANASSKRPSQ